MHKAGSGGSLHITMGSWLAVAFAPLMIVRRSVGHFSTFIWVKFFLRLFQDGWVLMLLELYSLGVLTMNCFDADMTTQEEAAVCQFSTKSNLQ